MEGKACGRNDSMTNGVNPKKLRMDYALESHVSNVLGEKRVEK
jgi:hypothetical protein